MTRTNTELLAARLQCPLAQMIYAADVECQETVADFLEDLLEAEAVVRRERYLGTRTRMAHLPYQRTLERSTLLSSRRSINGRLRNWPA